MTSSEEKLSLLPPSMGFPMEEWCDGGTVYVAYYTCVIGPFRVFVYVPGGLPDVNWYVERKVNNTRKAHTEQFFNSHGHRNSVVFDTNCQDPLTVMAIIRELTSESNEDANPNPPRATVGTDDDVLAPYFT